MSITQTVSVRPASPDDDGFLRELFANTRESEFASLDEETREALITMQFNLQRQQYMAGYPQAEHSIILSENRAIGRMLVDEAEQEFTLVDIALLAAYRNSGIGTYLLEQLTGRAAAAKKGVRLHVFKSNPAQGLYERLGFSKIGEDGMYLEMLYPPAVLPPVGRNRFQNFRIGKDH